MESGAPFRLIDTLIKYDEGCVRPAQGSDRFGVPVRKYLSQVQETTCVNN